MTSTIILTCIICQTAVGIYLLNIRKLKDDFERNINILLIILLLHLCTKLFLLVILKNEFLYSKVASGFSLSYGPLIYVITRLLVQRPVPQKYVFLHMFPFLFFSIMYFVLIAAGSMNFISHEFMAHYTSGYYKYVAVVSLLIYPILVKFLIRGFSTHGQILTIRLKLMNQIASILLLGIMSGLFFALTDLIHIGVPNFDLRIAPYICYAIIPILIVRYKIQEANDSERVTIEKIVHQEEVILIKPDHRYEKSSLDETSMDEYENRLKQFMLKSRIYLNAELSLESLAQEVKIPKHHLTQLLNDRFKKNFYSFVNQYRIDEAIVKLRSHRGTENILSLAYDCGFNSKSSFNNYFKKVTGKTPSAYRKLVLEHD